MGRHKGTQSNAKERLLESVGRGFKVAGYGGIGVDALAKEAGFTSGAFYAHFGSKAQAFRFALVEGLTFLRRGVETFKERDGASWQRPFVDFYFGERMAVALGDACALPTLTSDVSRADEPTREAYETELQKIADTITSGLVGRDKKARAWVLLALLCGGAGMARAVKDDELRREILAAVRAAARAV